MCGIAGFFGMEDKPLLMRMTDSLEHRGPDDFGYYTDRNVCLGHRRLSIIDLSRRGKQPIFNENKDICVIFNGEIYNFKELRKELEKKSHKFKSDTDTEVIVHAYEEYGEKCLALFNGMFAFALYDGKKKKILLARDRMGVKPLYFTFSNKVLYFASEIKSLLENKRIKREINYRALHDFLTFRCNSTSETMFKGIYKLAPGYYLTYDFKKNLMIDKYWNLTVKPDITMTELELSEKLYELIRDSVKMRMISDVPLGAYISGGIDSGTILSFMAEFSNKPVKTFSVGFGFEEEYNELNEAKFLSEHFRTDHKEIIVEPETLGIIPKIIWHADEPMADPTSIPVYLLSRETKPNVTVVLTGDGGDEQFGGYEQIKIMNLYNQYGNKIPGFVKRIMPKIARSIPNKFLNKFFKYASELGEEGINRFDRFLNSENDAERYLELVSIFNDVEKNGVYNDDTVLKTSNFKLSEEITNKYFSKDMDFLNQVLYLDNDKILAEDMMMKADKNTMAFGVEERTPFLDYRITEFMATVPVNLKINGSVDKYLLRKAMARSLPERTITRQKSRFFVPINRWFEEGNLMDIAKMILSRENINKAGIFNYNYIEKMFNNYNRSKLFYSRQLWCLLTFEVWRKMFIEGRPLNTLDRFVD